MVKIILFECRKHFFKSSIFFVIALLTLLNVAKIGSIYNEKSLLSQHFPPAWGDFYQQQYSHFSGAITMEKINHLLAIYAPLERQTSTLTASTTTDKPNTFTGNVCRDCFFFRDCYMRPMQYFYQYEENAKNRVFTAQENIYFYQSLHNNYEIRKNTVIAKLYHGREIKSFAYTEMYQYLFQYDFPHFSAC